MPFVVVSAGAPTDHSADAKVRRPRRELNSAAQGIRTIIRSPVRNLQQDDEDDRENAPYLSVCIGRYPGYNLELGAWVNPNGHVRTIYLQDGGASGTEMLFEFDVYENEDHCKDCRIHIVTGTTCEDADEVGGHYWNSDVISEDPWTRRNGAFYNSNNNGKAIGAFEVDNGYSYEENLGHAVVIYAMDGRTKIGCGILEDGDQGMHCDPFADGSGERDDGGDDDSSDVEDESEISQDVQSEISPSRPSSPSSPSASAPSPSAPSPSYSSDMSFDHGDRSDDVRANVEEKHDTAGGIGGRRGHHNDTDEEESEDESSVTEESDTTTSKHGKSSKKSKGSSKKTKSSKSSKGNSTRSDNTRYSKEEKVESKSPKHMSTSNKSKQKSIKSAKKVRRRQR